MSWRTVPSVNRVSVPSSGPWPGCGEGFCRAGPAGNEGKRLMSWTDERVELLKKLWADGLSASQIAGELGGITRNAVIGKVHRLGLSGRAKSPSSSAPRVRKPRSHMMRVQRSMSRGNTALALAYEMEQEPEPELIELNEDTCRWPIGDPATSEFFFCGGKPLTGLPYCNYHSRVAYQPANERRNRKPPFRQG